MKKILKKKNKGFTRLVDFGDAPTKVGALFKASPKFTTGFTLVETLVAVSIFTLSILALLVVLTQGISNNNYAKKKIIASYLAEEGIEYVRNMRDTIVLYNPTDSQTGWDAFYTKVAGDIYPAGTTICAAGDGCYFDDLSDADYGTTQPMADLLIHPCSGTCPELKYEEATGKYNYTFGVNSGYIRKIGVTQISANEIKISSTITWTQGSGSYSITFSENLFNWIE